MQPSALPAPFTNLFTQLDFEVGSWEYRDDGIEDRHYYDSTELARLVIESRNMMRSLLTGTGTQSAENADRDAWVSWLLNYGPGKFYDAFIATAQNAESECRNCHEQIYLDISEGCGVPDWRTADGDYGCEAIGTGSDDHVPAKLND